jgi:hypothetical protein
MTLFNRGLSLENASGYIVAQLVAGIIAVSFVNGIQQRFMLK